MKNRINHDLTNQVFDKIKVIELISYGEKSSHNNKWKCLCECGEYCEYEYASLIYKKQFLMCKKCRIKLLIEEQIQFWINQEFEWLIIESFAYNKGKTLYFYCRCKCNNLVIRSLNRLKSGSARCCSKKCSMNKMKLELGYKDNFSRPEVQQRCRDSLIKKYNIDNVSYLPSVIEKRKAKYRQKNGGKLIKEWAEEQNKSISCMGQHIKKYGLELALKINKKNSGIELKLETLIPKNIVFKRNKKIDKYIPDFIFEDQKLIIECDGLYWHSDKILNNKKYHIEKKENYSQNGYDSLFFREDEINNSALIVKSILINKLNLSEKIYARKCSIVELNKELCKDFMESNHLMGHGQGKCIGLIYNNQIVCALQFINKKNYIEISRFCNILNTSVIGGLSKLIKQLPKKEIHSFIDLRYGNGLSLKKIGFELINTSVSFKWASWDKTFHRMKYPKNTGYQSGLAKIWDCGQAKYIKYA